MNATESHIKEKNVSIRAHNRLPYPHLKEEELSDITGSQAKAIIRECGKSQREFARYLGRSEAFLRGSRIGGSRTRIPLQYVRALRAFVGEHDYRIAYALVTKKTEGTPL
jgi:hypothetical protein